ncbi:potassium channel family protein [Inhella proteolytica]|uniref:Two pore domain potassium channel family protein n=1 Tax=Inhella proteolytica TaxID=2795029 RepID=A0A931J6L5_9BURK|nr:potassium channel family protein [Inhella proteolytica]MBH9579190.1 two pore domain potassium channel family protein [Inhella proteolytica]
MPLVALICALLVVATTLIHYEALRALNYGLPTLRIAGRLKLVVVILVAFVAHAAEMLLYAIAFYGLVVWLGAGELSGNTPFSFANCLYFSAETYTSLGFGDLAPVGAVRLLAGIEALNGLLLIGWSASFTYLAMERFWGPGSQ